MTVPLVGDNVYLNWFYVVFSKTYSREIRLSKGLEEDILKQFQQAQDIHFKFSSQMKQMMLYFQNSSSVLHQQPVPKICPIKLVTFKLSLNERNGSWIHKFPIHVDFHGK